MNRWTRWLLAVLLCSPGALAAQKDSVARRHDATTHVVADTVERGTWRRAAVHYGKWLPVAVAVAFTAMGAHEHDNAQREFDRLLALCRADIADCALGSDGRYVNPTAEHLYQASVNFDRRARTRLLAGQASLLVAAGLFIADLRQRSRGPGNKPFAPLEVLGNVWADGARVGLRVNF